MLTLRQSLVSLCFSEGAVQTAGLLLPSEVHQASLPANALDARAHDPTL